MAEYALGASLTAALHPLGYARFLIQIGHEPMSPVASKNLFGTMKYYYPNGLAYISHIKQREGFLGKFSIWILALLVVDQAAYYIVITLHSVHCMSARLSIYLSHYVFLSIDKSKCI